MGKRQYAPWVAIIAMLAVGAGVPGCASSGGSSSEYGRPDVLTQEQMESVSATNLYDIIDRLRPRWLRIRDTGSNQGRRIVVVRGGATLGGIEVLRQTGPEGILELRYKSGEEASILVGSRDGFVEAVIEIVRSP